MPTAATSNGLYDLSTWSRMHDPKGGMLPIVNMLAQINTPFIDAVYQEANLPLAHQIVVNSALPVASTKGINYGGNISRGQFQQFTEKVGIFEVWGEYDYDLLNTKSDRAGFLYAQSVNYWEAMIQKWCNSLFYGNPATDPTQILGLATRYFTVNPANATNALNVIDAGGTGSANTSLWLMEWSDQGASIIHDSGSPAGLIHETFENVVLPGGSGSYGIGVGTRQKVFQEKFAIRNGLAVADWRRIIRIANIDVNNLANAAGAADLTELLVNAIMRLPGAGLPASETGNPMTNLAPAGKMCIYGHRTVLKALRQQTLNKAGSTIHITETAGKKNFDFDGIPFRLCDQLSLTEARVV